MQDHSIVGAVLFGIGAILVAIAYTAPQPPPLFLLGDIFAFNRALWLILWCRKQEIAAQRACWSILDTAMERPSAGRYARD
jgi:hypothetical protein